jgi:hypothetical protein
MTRSSARRIRKRAASRKPRTPRNDVSLKKLLRTPFTWVCLLVSTPLYVAGLVYSVGKIDAGLAWFVGAFVTGAFGWLPIGWRLLARISGGPSRRPAPETLGFFGALLFTVTTGILVVAVRAIWA